jgi:hypothetical protein
MNHFHAERINGQFVTRWKEETLQNVKTHLCIAKPLCALGHELLELTLACPR